MMSHPVGIRTIVTAVLQELLLCAMAARYTRLAAFSYHSMHQFKYFAGSANLMSFSWIRIIGETSFVGSQSKHTATQHAAAVLLDTSLIVMWQLILSACSTCNITRTHYRHSHV